MLKFCYFFCWLLDEYFDTGNRSLKTKANGLHDSGEISALPGSLKRLFLSGCKHAHLCRDYTNIRALMSELLLDKSLWETNNREILALTSLLFMSSITCEEAALRKEDTPLLQKFLRNQDTPLLQKFLCLFQLKLYHHGFKEHRMYPTVWNRREEIIKMILGLPPIF